MTPKTDSSATRVGGSGRGSTSLRGGTSILTGRGQQKAPDRFELLASLMKDAIWEWDLATGQVDYSDRWRDLLGIEPDEMGHDLSGWVDRVPAVERRRVRRCLEELERGERHEVEFDHPIVHRDGAERQVHVTGRILPDIMGKPMRVIGTVSDITQSRQVERQLLFDTYHDTVTGLPNRTYFISFVQERLDQRAWSPEPSVSVLVISIDRFRQFADGLGLVASQQILQSAAKRLREQIEPGETLARLRDDQFCLLIDAQREPEEAQKRAKDVQSIFDSPFTVEGRPLFVSVSIGLATARNESMTAESLLDHAVAAAHQAESTGQSGAQETQSLNVDRRRQSIFLASELRLALERSEFRLRYQPIIELKTGFLCGFEALVRWENPRSGEIEPAEFIPLTEETGLIIPLGKWILGEACRQMGQWQGESPARRRLSISVNLSGRQLSDPDLVAFIRSVKQSKGLEHDSLRLEITESLMVDDFASASSIFSHLREMGIGIHVDDFGTGYSSLATLPQLPLDSLKIDRSFVQAMLESERMEQVVRTIITLAHTLGLEVTAEGVESREHLLKLRELGCDRAQGYFISPPLTPRVAEELLSRPTSWL
jgi:diguanylate cyclase (GGDEF)-like protein/PAS domain S-box-containing protein